MSEQKEYVASKRQNVEFVAHGRGCVCGVDVRDKARGTERVFRVVELIHLAVGEYVRCGGSGLSVTIDGVMASRRTPILKRM